MTATAISKLTREEQRNILTAMIDAGEPMGSRPKYTAHKILDQEFDAEGTWYWYEKMAEFGSKS